MMFHLKNVLSSLKNELQTKHCMVQHCNNNNNNDDDDDDDNKLHLQGFTTQNSSKKKTVALM